MKTYGVNWLLVWIALLIFSCPLFAWLDHFLFFHLRHTADPQPPVLAQAIGQSFFWTLFCYYTYDKTLADLKAIERLRQSLQRSEVAWRRRYRWLILWAIVFALVGLVSTICRLIFDSPSWLHVAGYSLLLPCSCLMFAWLIDKATEKGQLAQRLKVSTGRPEEAP